MAAAVCTSRYFTLLSLLLFFLSNSSADPNSTFYFKNFVGDLDFESRFALYGDAKVVSDGSAVRIGGSPSSSAGGVFYKKPIKFFEGNSCRTVSFSTSFSFLMSPENGNGPNSMAFVMVPVGISRSVLDGVSLGLLRERKILVLAVEFDTVMDDKHDDWGINANGSLLLKLSNISSINFLLNSGKKLEAWIDYQAGSKRLEVRLSKHGELKPVDPIVSFPIYLSTTCKKKERVFVGLIASNTNFSCDVYSWSFGLRRVPSWMHSQPLDPLAFSEKTSAVTVPRRRDCLLRTVAALVSGTACGALGASVVLFLWGIFTNRRQVVPEKDDGKPAELDYGKFKVVIDKAIKDGEKQ
ncbi:Non-specific serine/threonine protein kinase [Bertholletia excelsa]